MSVCGTRKYLAAEVYLEARRQSGKDRQGYTVTVDVWSLGVVGYELVYDMPRYKSEYENNGVRWCKKISKELQDDLGRDPNGLGQFLSNTMVVLEPKSRSSAGDCYKQVACLLETENGSSYASTSASYTQEENQATFRNALRNDGSGGPTIMVYQPMSVTVLKDPATAPASKKAGIERPKIDTKLLEIYARHFCARGWLPRPPKRHPSNAAVHATKDGPLAGRVAVVTGASSGIGAAVATALAREGAHVAIAARRTDALESLKSKIARSGGKVLVHKTDVTKREEVESLMRTANEKLGPIDILVSCAGVMYFTMMANVQTEEWERTVDVNCKGLLHCLSSTVPSMLSRGSGHIVAISSDAGRKVFPGLGVYSASKFFVEATLQSLRLETAGTGLRVTAVQPGNTATDLLGMSTDAEAIKKFGEPTGAKVLEPAEVADAIIYALRQPAHVAVNEVLIEPRDEPI
ncbi:Uu.00g136250.m01.CDS01 [Anthostomella pinea]|uniref:Uu.00g136250.m01.CDS01 n=1 Tax=Anthostomella pinea TaxID=933095 RepID=A0AAI8YL42_9PEZI|nr:Uu.00g136250.m01.CDS01 [Anthostomella pinea]